jgi:hypothetical protein
MSAPRSGAAALADALRARGGTLAASLRSTEASGADHPGDDEPGPAQLGARGPRARGHEREYELLLEMILEGSRLHYGEPRVLCCEDPDLALLLGDQLYAMGLARLAELGDLEAVVELADLISLVAQAQAQADDHRELTAAVWRAGAVAIGWGSSPEHAAAKDLARAGETEAVAALNRVAEQAGK